MYEGFIFIAIKKILEKFNLYYRKDDLYFVYNDFELKIEYTIEELFDFIKLDVEKYNESSAGIIKAFKFIIDSKFINSEIVNYLTNVDYGDNKINDLFSKYISLESTKNKISKYKYPLSRDIYIKIINYHFKNSKVEEAYENFVIKKQNEQRKYIKEKFSGLKIMEWIPGLKPGPKLDKIIKEFKDEISKNYNFEEFIKKSSNIEIQAIFKCWYDHISSI